MAALLNFSKLKMTTETYKSEALASVHDLMEGVFEIGAIDKVTMRSFDDACPVPVTDITPEAIKSIREREAVSQPVFARYLNVSRNLVSDWERGVKSPAVRLCACSPSSVAKGLLGLFEGDTIRHYCMI